MNVHSNDGRYVQQPRIIPFNLAPAASIASSGKEGRFLTGGKFVGITKRGDSEARTTNLSRFRNERHLLDR